MGGRGGAGGIAPVDGRIGEARATISRPRVGIGGGGGMPPVENGIGGGAGMPVDVGIGGGGGMPTSKVGVKPVLFRLSSGDGDDRLTPGELDGVEAVDFLFGVDMRFSLCRLSRSG